MIGNYEPDLKKKIKMPNEGEDELVNLGDNPFP